MSSLYIRFSIYFLISETQDIHLTDLSLKQGISHTSSNLNFQQPKEQKNNLLGQDNNKFGGKNIHVFVC